MAHRFDAVGFPGGVAALEHDAVPGAAALAPGFDVVAVLVGQDGIVVVLVVDGVAVCARGQGFEDFCPGSVHRAKLRL
jgi:hypothetical protein